jgi:hypothetical protein
MKNKIKINILHVVLIYTFLNIIVFCIFFYVDSIILERSFTSLLQVFYKGQKYDEHYITTFNLALTSTITSFFVFILFFTFPIKKERKIIDYFELR